MSWKEAFERARAFAGENDEDIKRFIAGTKGISSLKSFHESSVENNSDEDDREGGFRQPRKLAKFAECNNSSDNCNTTPAASGKHHQKKKRKPKMKQSSAKQTL